MPGPVETLVCSACQRLLTDSPRRGYYRVTAVDQHGHDKGVVTVCSIYCLMQWAYGFAARQGARGAMMLQGALKDPGSLKELLKSLVAKL